jgi:hypothetical protein
MRPSGGDSFRAVLGGFWGSSLAYVTPTQAPRSTPHIRKFDATISPRKNTPCREKGRARQKHYSRPELAAVLADHGLEASRIARISCPWSEAGLSTLRQAASGIGALSHSVCTRGGNANGARPSAADVLGPVGPCWKGSACLSVPLSCLSTILDRLCH